MKCVILAAGIGTRLRPATLRTPKTLLKVQGTPILLRLIERLEAAGLNDIAIVTGFREEQIRSQVRRVRSRATFTFIRNPRFRSTNNAYSLFLGRAYVGSSAFLLIDGDLVFGQGLLGPFLAVERRPNRIAVRVLGKHDEEEIRVRINRWDHVKEIGKHVSLKETYGESVGIAVFSAQAAGQLFDILEDRIRRGTGRMEFYESAFQEMIETGTRLWAVDIGKAPVTEIDTPEDLSRAEHLDLT